jgi:hypothetical protein
MNEVHSPPLVRTRCRVPLLAMGGATAPFRTFAAKDQAFLAVETVDQLVVYGPALSPQQRMNLSVPEADPHAGNLANAAAKGFPRCLAAPVATRRL